MSGKNSGIADIVEKFNIPTQRIIYFNQLDTMEAHVNVRVAGHDAYIKVIRFPKKPHLNKTLLCFPYLGIEFDLSILDSEQ